MRPELGLSVPHVPATREFEEMPVVGTLFDRARALYLERGTGEVQESLNRQIEKLTEQDATLMFFPEGTRSRSRRFLDPKRGLLRALKQTGRPCHLLPVSIAYDRVPEKRALEVELRGRSKPPKRLSDLLQWSTRLLENDIDLGHIHLKCGSPLSLEAGTDVYDCADEIARQHQSNMAITTYHLRCFVEGDDLEAIEGDDLVEVLESSLASELRPSEMPASFWDSRSVYVHEELDYRPRSPQQTLADTFHWLRAVRPELDSPWSHSEEIEKTVTT